VLVSLLCVSHTLGPDLCGRACLLCVNNRRKISFEAELEAVMTRQIIPEIFFALRKRRGTQTDAYMRCGGKYLSPRKHVTLNLSLTVGSVDVKDMKRYRREISSFPEYFYIY